MKSDARRLRTLSASGQDDVNGVYVGVVTGDSRQLGSSPESHECLGAMTELRGLDARQPRDFRPHLSVDKEDSSRKSPVFATADSGSEVVMGQAEGNGLISADDSMLSQR